MRYIKVFEDFNSQTNFIYLNLLSFLFFSQASNHHHNIDYRGVKLHLDIIYDIHKNIEFL